MGLRSLLEDIENLKASANSQESKYRYDEAQATQTPVNQRESNTCDSQKPTAVCH